MAVQLPVRSRRKVHPFDAKRGIWRTRERLPVRESLARHISGRRLGKAGLRQRRNSEKRAKSGYLLRRFHTHRLSLSERLSIRARNTQALMPDRALLTRRQLIGGALAASVLPVVVRDVSDAQEA